MRKWITLLMTLLVGFVSFANANTGQVTLEAGYRHDRINWRTRFPSNSPFLKTNTKFKDVDIFQIGIHGRSTIGCNFYVRANAYWGWVLDGDFEQKVKTYFSPSSHGYSSNKFNIGAGDGHHNVIDDKWVYGIGAAIGYPLYFCDCTMILAPVVGYAIDEQNFEIDDKGLDLKQSGSCIFPKSGSHCCEHKWINRWYGPFVGVDLCYRPYNECWNIFAEIEYHWGHFHGKRHVNNQFDGFGFNQHRFHAHDADGWVFAVGADYDLCNCWTFGIAAKFQDWHARRRPHRRNDSFSDTYYFEDISGHERHNFKWSSYEVKLAVGKEF